VIEVQTRSGFDFVETCAFKTHTILDGGQQDVIQVYAALSKV
jgi:hypothetical protein